MWKNGKTGKPESLKKILGNGFDLLVHTPERLSECDPVATLLRQGRTNVLVELEKITESDETGDKKLEKASAILSKL